jgi:ATP-dependent Zn protease
MTINDISLLGKKVLVGVVVTIIPFIIILGGLWLGRRLLQHGAKAKQVSIVQPSINRL